jgi:predicted amidohydrolase YtcJ
MRNFPIGQRTVFRGGPVLTADPDRPRAHAVAVEAGSVVALDDEAVDGARAGDDVVDLAGRCLVPGFGDGHIHPLWGGAELADAPVQGSTTVDELVDRLRRWAGDHPELPWITGGGYDPTLVPDGNGDAEILDAAVPDRPVLLWATDHHTAWVNSAALAAAGIDADTPDPALGTIVRRGDGRPLGALLEAAAERVAELIPPKTMAQRAEGLRLALRHMAAVGITWGQEAALEPDDVAAYRAVADAGDLTSRINVALRADPRSWNGQRDDFAAARRQANPEAGLTVNTVKFFADGIIEAGTGALLEPYDDAPDSCGLPNWSPDELDEAVAAFDGDGFQIHIHAIGDGAIRAALDAVEHAIERNGVRDRRPVIAHTQLVHPDDLARFAALGVIANFEPLWAQLDPIQVDLTEPRLGPERTTWQYPIAGLARLGTKVSFGSDWPVSSMNPLEGMAIAVTRRTAAGDPPEGWLPDQRISVEAALAGYTSGVAYQAFADAEAGMIAPGRRADLCLLAADPTSMPAQELAGVPVVGTWLAGREVFRGG